MKQSGPSPRNYRTPHSGVSQPGIGHSEGTRPGRSRASTRRFADQQEPLASRWSQRSQAGGTRCSHPRHRTSGYPHTDDSEGPRGGPQCRWISSESDLRKSQRSIHLMILVTRPEPTVRPPSRMAKPRPGSIAIGWISWTEISVVSPGMTMSVPSGRVMTPVTSVVRK